MRFRDWVVAYRIGSTHFKGFATSRIVALALVVVLLLMQSVILGRGVYSHYHGAVPVAHIRKHILPMLPFLAIGPLIGFSVVPLVLWLISSRTVSLDNQLVTVRSKVGAGYLRWRTVSAVFIGAEHIAICSTGLDALVIPVSAFQNRQDAEAFCANAHFLWQRSNNLLRPTVSEADIWPPAPCATNAQGRGANP